MKKSLPLTTLYLLTLCFLFCPDTASAQAPNFLWAKQGIGTNENYASNIALDASGNSYVVGSFQNDVTFDSTTLTTTGSNDMFFVKYDASGNVLWAKNQGGFSTDYGYGIAVDNSGNSYITGSFFSNSITFGNITLTNSGFDDIFLVKYDADGNLIWAKKAGGQGSDGGGDIAIDSNGNCLISGHFSGDVTFGSTVLSSNGDMDMFIAKYDTSGNVLWANKAGGPENDTAYDIATDANGNSYVTGYFSGSATFGTTTLSNSGSYDMFIAKYDASGNFLWVQKAGGTGTDAGLSTVVDASGNCYVTGYFRDAATFGSTTLTGAGGANNMFIARYDASGNLAWVKNTGTTSYEIGNGLAIDGTGNCYLTGQFVGSATFGSTTLISVAHTYCGMIVKYNPAGNVIWAMQAGGPSPTRCTGIEVDNSGNCYVTGYFEDSVTFGNIPLTVTSAGRDMFVTRLNAITGLEDAVEMAGISVFPNPFSTRFRIKLQDPVTEHATITLTNMLGQGVGLQYYTANAASEIEVIPQNNLPRGLYLLQVQTTRHTYSQRVMVE